MLPLVFILIMAALNRCRGSRFFGYLDSTSEGRILATLGMAVATELLALFHGMNPSSVAVLFLWVWPSLMFWCVWGWGNYFCVVTGKPPAIEREFPPVDWIMGKLKLPLVTNMQCRIWGLIAMTLRQSLAIVPLFGIGLLGHDPLYSLGASFIGLIYFIAGYAWPRNPILVAELGTGAWLGFLITQMI